MTPCGSGSYVSMVIGRAGIAVRPAPRSIGCAPPSRAYGSSIRPTSRGFRNEAVKRLAPDH